MGVLTKTGQVHKFKSLGQFKGDALADQMLLGCFESADTAEGVVEHAVHGAEGDTFEAVPLKSLLNLEVYSERSLPESVEDGQVSDSNALFISVQFVYNFEEVIEAGRELGLLERVGVLKHVAQLSSAVKLLPQSLVLRDPI